MPITPIFATDEERKQGAAILAAVLFAVTAKELDWDGVHPSEARLIQSAGKHAQRCKVAAEVAVGVLTE